MTERPKYRNRHGSIATNVLAVCTKDMEFVYVLPGWEGSAADGRVLRDALRRQNGLRVPNGKFVNNKLQNLLFITFTKCYIGYLLIFVTGCYYLVDAGYTNCKGFLAPFRSQRYHLKDWEDGPLPRNAQEFFNMKYSHARNVIERCFGVLKSQ